MKIGVLGIIIILIAIYSLLVKPTKILLLAVFFAPFTSCYVVEFDSFYLQPGHFFLFIHLLVEFVRFIREKRIEIKKPDRLLMLFVFESFLSVIVAYIINIDVLVYGIGNNLQLKSSHVTTQNFTQLIYLFLGFLLYMSVVNFSYKSEDNRNSIFLVLVYSGLVIAIIGVYQIIANAWGLPYDSIFRNDVNLMWQTKQRTQATFPEASYFGQFCLFIIPVILIYNWSTKKIYMLALFGMYLVLGITSRSSTFFIGSIVLLLMYIFLTRKDKRTVYFCILGPILAFILFIILYKHSLYFQLIFDSTVKKITLEHKSGIERSSILKYMIGIGMKYPILGIGYGGGRSTDLYSSVFASNGLCGLVLIVLYIFRNMCTLLNNRLCKENLICILWIGTFLFSSCAIPDLCYLETWIVFAIIDSICFSTNKCKLV